MELATGNESVELLNQIIFEAITSRASDIHFEPTREGINVRIRVDGLMKKISTAIDNLNRDSIISRIKVLAQLNITENRMPQDGHYGIDYQGKYYNFRVSTLSTIYGEAIVFRILSRNDQFLTLEKLGLINDQLEIINRLISIPSGMILTTGPTGSGKTSFLYSIVQAINTPENTVVTIEDPVEYEVENIRQTQINESYEFNFAKAMRAILRQDPNCIMLGEIRDAETAQIAMQAALSGISVLSTFHTFDIPFLVSRLNEMGITLTIIANTIKGVIETRLVRKICSFCKEQYQPDPREMRLLGGRQMNSVLMRGRGCEKCFNTGYLGRTGLFEITCFDNDIRSSIVERKTASFINELLKSKNILSLREVGYLKVQQGETTISEVVRVLGAFTP
jgi:general secretion pathway protein E